MDSITINQNCISSRSSYGSRSGVLVIMCKNSYKETYNLVVIDKATLKFNTNIKSLSLPSTQTRYSLGYQNVNEYFLLAFMYANKLEVYQIEITTEFLAEASLVSATSTGFGIVEIPSASFTKSSFLTRHGSSRKAQNQSKILGCSTVLFSNN